MITLKEKVSMLGMKAAMAVVVGLATVVKPAMNIVLDYKERWEAGDDKEFFARLKSVFDYSDETMPGTKKIDMDGIEMGEKASKCKVCRGCVGDKKHPTCPAHGDIKIEDVANAKASIDRGLELIDKLSQTTGEPNLQGIKKSLQALIGNLNECVCCDCVEDCYCMDCPVHSAKMIDDTKTELVELQVSMDKLMGGETNDISMKDIKKAAKQANKKTKALDIANDMVARSHCSISGRAFSNQVAKIMEWPEDKINSEWQPIVAKQANKKKPSKKTKAKKTTKAKK